MPGSPLAGLKHDDVVLSDGMIVAKAAASRSVSLADAMRHGGVERIEREKLSEFKEDNKHARNTHSAVFVEVKVDEQLGVIRVTRAVNARCRSHHQYEDRRQSDHGERGLGHRHGPP
jgi:xanthine dehydrogenase YagR molybdenum-binding subunit